MATNKYGCCPCNDDGIDMDEVIEVPSGEVDPAAVEQIVKDYMDEYFAENPPSGTPGESGKDGEDGQDGVSPTIDVEEIEGGYRLTITDVNGTQTVDIMHGKDGTGSDSGDSGEELGSVRGIANIARTDGDGSPGTTDTYTIEYTDGTTSTFTVYNGADGQDGASGKDGVDGKVPEKGVDYFTDDEIAEIAQRAAELVDPGTATVESLEADKIFFTEDLTTTSAIGNITLSNGQATIPAKGKNLMEVWNTIFVKEKNPATTQPSVSIISSEAKAYEVGTVITPTYEASLKPGAYTYGPETGITATAWEVKDSAGNTADTPTGTMPNLVVTGNTSYRITATATHGDGTVPVTNIGNAYPDGQIKAGTKSASTATAITGYRNSFYGTLTDKGELTSAVIRGLSMSGKALANGSSFDIDIPVGAMRVVIAYPATLRDLSSVKDVNGMSAEISTGFTPQTVAVSGANGYEAIDYKVYVMDFANANDTANTYTVTI